jgi:hypothetical protein
MSLIIGDFLVDHMIPATSMVSGQGPKHGDYAQHFLYFLPLPQGQGSLRPTLGEVLFTGAGFTG